MEDYSVWIVEVRFRDAKGKWKSLIKAFDHKNECIEFLNSSTIRSVLGKHKTHRGVFWNLAEESATA